MQWFMQARLIYIFTMCSKTLLSGYLFTVDTFVLWTTLFSAVRSCYYITYVYLVFLPTLEYATIGFYKAI